MTIQTYSMSLHMPHDAFAQPVLTYLLTSRPSFISCFEDPPPFSSCAPMYPPANRRIPPTKVSAVLLRPGRGGGGGCGVPPPGPLATPPRAALAASKPPPEALPNQARVTEVVAQRPCIGDEASHSEPRGMGMGRAWVWQTALTVMVLFAARTIVAEPRRDKDRYISTEEMGRNRTHKWFVVCICVRQPSGQ